MDIKLKDFQGPLDLLLHLVSKYEVDIYDVPIVEVIEQYLAYLATLKAMKLEIAGDYMVMASQLMLIKSRKLLPKVIEEIIEEEDPEYELLTQIEEYKRFKALGQELSVQHEERAKHYSKPKTEVISDDVQLAFDKTIVDVFMAFSKVMAEQQETFKLNHTMVAAEQYRIEDMMLEIEGLFQHKRGIALREIFQAAKNKEHMITLFLASLELIKRQFLTVVQDNPFDEIMLVKETA